MKTGIFFFFCQSVCVCRVFNNCYICISFIKQGTCFLMNNCRARHFHIYMISGMWEDRRNVVVLALSNAKVGKLASGLVICTRYFSSNIIKLGAWKQPNLKRNKEIKQSSFARTFLVLLLYSPCPLLPLLYTVCFSYWRNMWHYWLLFHASLFLPVIAHCISRGRHWFWE